MEPLVSSLPDVEKMRKVESSFIKPPCQIQNKGRFTEFGVFTKNKPVNCAYVFENDPIWLCSFTPKTLGVIYMVDFDDFSSLFKHLKTNQYDLKLYNSLTIIFLLLSCTF